MPLYGPATELTENELVLYSRVTRKALERNREHLTRGEFMQLLQATAKKRITDIVTREAMVEHIMAYLDELSLVFTAGNA